MLPFRTEIRNTPKEQTLIIYLSNIGMDKQIKELLKSLDGVKQVEIQKSLARNRVEENVTIYTEDDVNINDLKIHIENILTSYFNEYSH